jgi:ketosteroid isomerase-like protein
MLGCWRATWRSWGDEDEITITVERVLAAGDRQVPLVRFRGHGSSSGIPFEHLWGYVVELRHGRIAYLRAYHEPEDAVEAAGVAE